MRGLSIMHRTNVRGHWTLAAFHHPESITWSWALAWSFFRADEARVWPLFARFRLGQQKWMIRLPFVGYLSWASQEVMWRKGTVHG